MKVITPGKPGQAWTRQVTCTGLGNGGEGCGAVLEVTFADIYATSSSHYDGSTDYYKTFCCPCCGAETDIATSSPKYYNIRTDGKRPSEVARKAIQEKYMQGTDL